MVGALLPLSFVAADPILVPLQVGYEDPWDNQTGPKRTPTPVLYIDGYTLTAGDNTLGTTIQILDEDDEVVFSTYVAIEGDIQLPSTLSGTYTIQVISGDLTFIGEIEL